MDDTERDIWLASFAKVLECNAKTANNRGAGQTSFSLQAAPDMSFIGRKNSAMYGSLMGKLPTRSQGKAITDGVSIYKSPELQVTKTIMEGHVMKAIENLGIFNGKAYHKRYLKVEFGQPHIQFFEKKSDSTFHKLQK